MQEGAGSLRSQVSQSMPPAAAEGIGARSVDAWKGASSSRPAAKASQSELKGSAMTRMARKSTVMAVAMATGALLLVACGGDDDDSSSDTNAVDTTVASTTAAPTETTAAPGPVRTVAAPAAAITVDGDPADWADVPSLDVALEAIVEADGVDPRDATIQVAHDDANLYMLYTVTDDYSWNADDAHLSAALAVMFPAVEAPGPHMGATDQQGENTAGTVDIWHWELDCAAGEATGGAANPNAEGDPGNDSVCNFDDEWSTDPENREDDNTATGENSLTGVWGHSNAVEGGAGDWYFEISRPLQTGDEQDAQFTVGESTQLALAYWDPSSTPEGWEDDGHVQSANQGWIQVDLT